MTGGPALWDKQTPNLGVSKKSPLQMGLSSQMKSKFETGSSETPELGASTADTDKMGKTGNPYWKSNSILSIINQFKRICTITAKTNGLDLIWQSRFYDRIIRSQTELNRIRKYIMNNPQDWNNDEHNYHNIK